MAANYYLSSRRFTSKAGRECFVASFLSQNSQGDWQGVDKFVNEEIYESLSDLDAGAACRVSTDLSGNISGVELSTKFAPLSLDAKL